MDKFISSKTYLTKVLSSWNKFCVTHKRLRDSIELLLLENELLKGEIDKLIFYLSESEENL